MRVVRLLAQQIPLFWDAIKYAVVQADEVEEADLQPYLVDMLHNLLCDKAQCFVAVDDKRVLQGLIVTRIVKSTVTEEKGLFAQALYIWTLLDGPEWQSAMEVVTQYAKKEGCRTISFNSRNPIVWRKTERMGFREKTRTYEVVL